MAGILVTGMGIITSMGAGKDQTMLSLRKEVAAIGRDTLLDTVHSDLPVGEVPYDDDALRLLLGCDLPDAITRTALLGRVALKEAVEQAGLDRERPKRLALISGTTVGGMEKSEKYYRDFLENFDHSEYIALHDCGASTDMIAKQYPEGFDMMTTVSTACSSAANAIILGANLIKAGIVDAVLAGGSECLTKFHLNGFNSLMILDKNNCRPFDKGRQGLNLGEGAGYVVIESESSAKRRGVSPICRLSGYGNACDAYHQTASSPDGQGAYLAMEEALRSASLEPSEIDYINAHGTGTLNNDLSEGKAVMRVFGDDVPPISSTKSFTGHTTSASGGVESVIGILSIVNRFIPANLGFSERMDELSFIPVIHSVENADIRNVLTNSFGFGGNDSSCIFSKI
jgi:3-oxoacyl-[acyl-carrier-protein] synthase-1